MHDFKNLKMTRLSIINRKKIYFYAVVCNLVYLMAMADPRQMISWNCGNILSLSVSTKELHKVHFTNISTNTWTLNKHFYRNNVK